MSPQALLQLPYLDSFYGYSLKLLRYADTTSLASLVRADWTFYSSHPALFLSTYLAHGLLVDYFEKKRRCAARSEEESSTNLEWLTSLWDWYTSYLLLPIASLQQVPVDQSDWEDDPNFLLERLAFPDLWLRPLVPVDYIKALPTWRFRAVNHQREEKSVGETEGQTDSTDSDADNRMQSDSPPVDQTSRTQTIDTPPDQISRKPIQPQTSRTQSDSPPDHSSGKVMQSQSSSDSEQEDCLCGAQQQHINIHNNNCHCSATGNGASPPSSLSREEPQPVHHHHQQSDWSVWPCGVLHCSECVVCLETFVSDELLMGLPCGHAFHQQCIVVWLAAGRHCCPVCRWPSYKKKKWPNQAEPAGTDSTEQD